MKKAEKITAVAEQLSEKTENSRFGISGAVFITTRVLSEKYGISLQYANEVMNILCEKRLIMLLGKHYYLTYKKAELDSPFYQKYKPQKRFGMILSDLGNSFVSELAQKMANEVAKTDFSLNIAIESNNINSITDEFLKEKVSGIFVDPFVARNNADFLKKCPLPVVSVGYDLSAQNIDSITVDNFGAGKMIAEHFFEIGCNHFVYIGFKRRTKPDERLNGYKAKIEKNGLTLNKDNIILIDRNEHGKYNNKILYSEIKKLVWKTSSFKKIGIFCYHDFIAYDVINALGNMELENLDRKIPKNIAIAGFDNLSIASVINPSLTTVSYPTDEMAQKGVAAMLDAVTNKNHKECKKEIEFALIKRKTTEV